MRRRQLMGATATVVAACAASTTKAGRVEHERAGADSVQQVEPSTHDNPTTDTDLPRTENADDDTQIVVDFNWSYPGCPAREVNELDRYFFGDLDRRDGFHVNHGRHAEDPSEGCTLRTDGDGVETFSLPDGHVDQPDILEHYPRRGETIVFDHYVHRMGANMEFRFGVQRAYESYYAVRLETESDPPALRLLRADEGLTTELDKVPNLEYTNQLFHEFQIQWLEDEITVSLVQHGESTTLSADDETYDQGGIGFFKEHSGLIRSYAHLWNNVEVKS